MNCYLIVINDKGEELPGYVIRAGDRVVGTEYSHSSKVVTVHIGRRVSLWRFIWEWLTPRKVDSRGKYGG